MPRRKPVAPRSGRPSSRGAPPRVGFVSLGCPKALVDSEHILTQLRCEGYDIAPTYAGADLVVVNTCGFIDAAIDESLQAIGEALEENGRVVVTGCLGAQGERIREAFPQVLAITGPHDQQGVMQAVHQYLPAPHDPFTSLVPPQGIRLTPRHYAYLKISEGCNHRCTFCIIPSLRGDLVSRSVAEVMHEAENLVRAGVKELLVISQDTSAYGVDVRYRTGFWGGRPVRTRLTELSAALGELGVWVRLHYVYPYLHVDELLALMQDGKILPYLDVPLQHASASILRAMKRPGDVDRTLERIRNWRRQCPDLTLRSTFIVGFPGETEQDFQQLLAFLDQAQIDRAGCFAYSAVAGASANALPGAVPEAVKQERLERFMAHQAKISAQRLQNQIGRMQQVLVDALTPEGGALARGRGDAPEIDGQIHVAPAPGLSVGSWCQVRIESADEHDLFARVQA